MASGLHPKHVVFDDVWGLLHAQMENIILLKSVQSIAGMDLIGYVYKLCTALPRSFAEDTYIQLKRFFQHHVDSILQRIQQTQGDVLVVYRDSWRTYDKGSQAINGIFRYLNDNWIRRRTEETRGSLGGMVPSASPSAQVFPVATLALVVWRDTLFMGVREKLRFNVREVVTRERDGEQIDRAVVGGVVQSFVRLGLSKNRPLEVYRDEFEAQYLQWMTEYYRAEAANFLAQNSVADYMRKAETRLAEEAARAKAFLDSSSYDKAAKCLDDVLVGQHRAALHGECKAMLTHDNTGDLSRMYHLLRRIEGGVDPMLATIQEYIQTVGLSRLRDLGAKAKEPEGYVEELLSVYAKYRDVVTRAFGSDGLFVTALDKAMRTVVNETEDGECKSPELLAKYCDVLLKKHKGALEDAALDSKLDQITSMFKYVDDKDVFQKYYARLLSRRLINQSSVSDDAESGMLSRLKQACGFEFTSKLQKMFMDMRLSDEINSKFIEHCTARTADMGGVSCRVQVLTAGCWPLQASKEAFSVPLELEKCMKTFELYYHHAHQGRKLSWLHHIVKASGNAELKTNYLGAKKDKELLVTNYQMAILLMYNRGASYTLANMETVTQLKDGELKATVQSLLKAGLLTCSTGEDALESDSVLTVNLDFKDKRHRVKVTAAAAKETPAERKKTSKEVDEDRKLFLQALIVRIMKARKTLQHQQLIADTIKQSEKRFIPSVQMIKKCIEQLIDKGYLERAEGQKGVYNYKA